ncbi:UPF0688 protein C1orf174 homolog [Struthio camelus]|uniref:UPF0688 protein C1orf174 homolog n=1 Tax=Struthio camelus TaxID=8801 RepID=UPI003604018C
MKSRKERGGPAAAARTVSLPCPRKATDTRPSKRLKGEKSGLVKSARAGRAGGSGTRAARREAPSSSAEGRRSGDAGDGDATRRTAGQSVAETRAEGQGKEGDLSPKPSAVDSSSAPSEAGSAEDLQNCACRVGEESSCESVLSGESGLEDRGAPKTPVQRDDSAFLDEDSNQPMPVDRFFGNVEFIQDLPAVALASTTMSRREFRKLHFIAKEDEEEEEDVL